MRQNFHVSGFRPLPNTSSSGSTYRGPTISAVWFWCVGKLNFYAENCHVCRGKTITTLFLVPLWMWNPLGESMIFLFLRSSFLMIWDKIRMTYILTWLVADRCFEEPCFPSPDWFLLTFFWAQHTKSSFRGVSWCWLLSHQTGFFLPDDWA